MANDLREVVAALKIAAVVERIGDYAKNIAKRVPMIESETRYRADLHPAGDGDAWRARWCTPRSTPSPRATRRARFRCARATAALDDFYDSIFRTLVTYMVENPRTIGQVAHLLFVAKNLERIGDHATNVAEMVYFAATGTHMAERERGGSTI